MAGLGGTCQACGHPGMPGNPLIDYRHAQSCMIYEPSGSCSCGRPGFIAHEFRCPVKVEGDTRPPAPALSGDLRIPRYAQALNSHGLRDDVRFMWLDGRRWLAMRVKRWGEKLSWWINP